ncbi:L-fucose:H+ symporter permease [Steroidobacter sp. S1-65]|uniref:L-fucose:H+ symporter permease n=1 Tax=Steroidobacter gossypii TaxID=2805490 RepID=A0ABS1X0X6_9GAMM|nr:L-fucose:H+ symporter permease [Steroidobacter gossypii]MBM0106864.1 L-fucose:H+ symporter permease [Steroidobacter gossypii]
MPAEPKSSTPLAPLILIVTLFFLWGVANNLNDVLMPHLRKAFFLTDLQSSLVQSAFYLGYFFLALPAGWAIQRWGYQRTVLIGLLVFGVGALMFYPAAEFREYAWFLAALFVVASGLAFLETSANPLMTVLGDPARAEQRLNLAQAFNPLGAISGVLIGREFILSGVEPTQQELAAMSAAQLEAFQITEAQSVQMPYLVIAGVVLTWAVLVAMTKFPPQAQAPEPASRDSLTMREAISQLRGKRHFLFGVAAQFFYVGAQVGIWSFMIRYAQAQVPGMGEKSAAAYLTWSLVAFMVGRFVGTALMIRFTPTRLMGGFALANVVLTLTAVFVGGPLGLYALAASSFFMSIMFPTIFASSLRELGPLTKAASSFLVMSIIGGAVLTALMGAVSDAGSIRFAMLVPTVCFLVVGSFAWNAGRVPTHDLKAVAAL